MHVHDGRILRFRKLSIKNSMIDFEKPNHNQKRRLHLPTVHKLAAVRNEDYGRKEGDMEVTAGLGIKV
jgi:hypothetical protein